MNSKITYPSPPSDYPECRERYYSFSLTAPFSAAFHLLVDAFDDMAYTFGKIGRESLLIPMEGIYEIMLQASWLPLGIPLAASPAEYLTVDTREREDAEGVFSADAPHNIIYTVEEK